MALENTEIIDQILQPNDDRRIGLVIADSGEVADPRERLNLLKKKFEYYVEAALEGSVHPSYRYTDPNDFYIDVVCAHPPTKQMLKISEVAREGDTKHRLKVNYRESRHGVWTEASAKQSAAPLENLAGDKLNDIITAAFDASHNCLRAGEKPVLLLFVKSSTAYLLTIKDLDTDDEVASALAEWATENASDVSTCVVVRFSAWQDDARSKDAFVAHVLQRGLKEGLILAQELYEDNGAYHGSGRLVFLGCCENTLISNSL